MKYGRGIFFIVLFFIAAFTFTGASPAVAELKAGAGRVDITPEPGCFLGGYFFLTSRSKGVHDPLNSRALVLDDGKNRIAIIALDLIIASGVMVAETKEKIHDQLGIPIENINISVAHTHTGPEGYYEEYGKYPKEYLPAMKLAIEDKTVEAVRKAIDSLAPASVGYESFDLNDFSHNRHDPEGPTDRTAVLLVVKDAAGKPVAGFLNFAAHPTVVDAGDLLISGEWTGMFQSLMEEKMGQGAVFLYLQGAAGNVGPGTHDAGDNWAKAKDMAERMAGEVFPRLGEVKTKSDITVAAARKDYDFKIRTKKSYRDYELAIPSKTKEIQDDPALSKDLKDRRIEWLSGRSGIERFMQMLFPTMKRIKGGKTHSLIEAMRIGDLLLLAFPGEAITELSMELRKDLSPAMVAVLGYSNDHLGYITNKKIYDEGGYEAGMGLVFPESTDEMVKGLLELAKDLAGK